LIGIAKKNYFELNLDKSKNDPKNTWSFINEALNRKSIMTDKIESIRIKDDVINDSREIADNFT